jgi:hypothetical protein
MEEAREKKQEVRDEVLKTIASMQADVLAAKTKAIEERLLSLQITWKRASRCFTLRRQARWTPWKLFSAAICTTRL